MLVGRKELENYLNNKTKEYIFDSAKKQAVIDYVNNKYKIPRSKFLDIFSKRESIEEQPDQILFIYLDAIDNLLGSNKKVKYFTEIEIASYSAYQYATEKISFPIRISCYPVSDDQWIGVVNTDLLFQMQKANLIRYNENTQRVMQQIKKGDIIKYVISINKTAVKKIVSLFAKNTYIPDDLTFNIPLDSDYSFYYNNESKELVIERLEVFDIIDGYHRFLAMKQEKQLNKNFKYPMELRVTNFSEEKTRQFIFQKDQKTQMSKVKSDSMNMDDAANITLERLNQDVLFLMRGELKRSNGKIPFSDFAVIVRYFYFNSFDEKQRNKLIMEATKDIRNKLNAYIESDEKLINSNFTFKQLLFLFTAYNIEDIDLNQVPEIVNKALEIEIDKSIEIPLKQCRIYKPLVNKIENIIREVKIDV